MKIGLTQRILFHKERAYDAIEHGWYSYLKDHTLVFIPNNIEQDFNQLACDIELLIITGGNDDPIRVLTEIRAATAVLKQNKPIIGVCHGAFLLTTMLGGEIGKIAGHSDTEHVVQYNKELIRVNSYHSNCITQTPQRAQILCTDSNGHCEAWIDQKIAAIVWHPERMSEPWLPDEITRLFNDF